MALSWTPGDLSGKKPLWGKFVVESFNSAALSVMRHGIVAASPLLDHVIESKRKTLIIRDTFTCYYREKGGQPAAFICLLLP